MKIQFIVVGWHYHQQEFYEGLKELEDTNEEISVFWSCHKEPIKYIKDILVDIYKLNKVINDDVIVDINRINSYILSRVICLPFSPESVENGILRAEVELPNGFVELNATNNLKYLIV